MRQLIIEDNAIRIRGRNMGENMTTVKLLMEGKTVQFRPHGNSMRGKINNGQLVTVEPVVAETVIAVGDAVLAKVGGRVVLHLVGAIESDGRYRIENIKGHINGRCTRASVFGKVTKVED